MGTCLRPSMGEPLHPLVGESRSPSQSSGLDPPPLPGRGRDTGVVTKLEDEQRLTGENKSMVPGKTTRTESGGSHLAES